MQLFDVADTISYYPMYFFYLFIFVFNWSVISGIRLWCPFFFHRHKMNIINTNLVWSRFMKTEKVLYWNVSIIIICMYCGFKLYIIIFLHISEVTKPLIYLIFYAISKCILPTFYGQVFFKLNTQHHFFFQN